MSWLKNLKKSSPVIRQSKPCGQKTSAVDDRQHRLNANFELDDQPGPSGLRPQSRKTELDSEDALKKESKPKTTDPVQLFSEKVAIAGLEEAYNSKLLVDRVMFRIALAAFFLIIIYEAFLISRQYGSINAFFIDTEVNEKAPFPTVSICFPISFNEKLVDEWLLPHLPAVAIKNGITTTDVTEYIKNMYALNTKPSDVNTLTYLVARKTMDKAKQFLSDRNQSFWDVMIPTCASVLSNCSFDGKPFDCCERAVYVTDWGSSCYEVKVNTSANANSARRDSMQLKDIGLTVDVSIDWTYGIFQDESASDGLHVFIDESPSLLKVPVHVPSGVDALIVMSQPEALTEVSHCYPNNRAPQLKHFGVYDSHGIRCTDNFLVDDLLNNFGCSMVALDYRPPPDKTCALAQTFLMSMLLSNIDVDELKSVFGEGRIAEKIDRMHEKSKVIFASDESPCLPLCSRWIYPVFSASYGSIQYKDKNVETDQLANRSWSRIRVILPHSSSWSSQEKPVAAKYLVMCKIGGVMGVYIGLSMITFTQILAYGFYIVWYKKKKKHSAKVSPMAPEAANNFVNGKLPRPGKRSTKVRPMTSAIGLSKGGEVPKVSVTAF